MDFKTKRIRKEPRQREPSKKLTKPATTFATQPSKENLSTKQKPRFTIHFASLIGSIALVILLLGGIYQVFSSLNLSKLIFSFGTPLQANQAGKTNILLVGVGGGEHDGANLTDTIIVASIDHNNKVVPMLSIPRDFYIMDQQQRINSVYDWYSRTETPREGLTQLQQVVEDVTGLPIQYYIKVNFEGFIEIVDSLGGIEMNIENTINDPYYPKEGTTLFEPFYLPAGFQTLDGETALKYARSRKSTSDFDRAKRQQQLLYAIKETALNLDIITNSSKIRELYSAVENSIETNLSFAEIIELGKIAQDFQKDAIVPLVLNDDPINCGGFLYTPARSFFSGASVLIPAGLEYDYIQLFISLMFKNLQAIDETSHKIQVLNGTKVNGLAGEGLNLLSRFCLNVVYYGNAAERPLETSTIYYQPDEEGNPPAALDIITELMPIKTQPGIPKQYLETPRRSDSTIVVELGLDYLDVRLPDPFDSLQFLASPEDEEDDTENQDTIKSTDTTPDTTPSSLE